ncbi:deoxyribonuclease I activity protein [Homalodisca vitripennis]|nr:deoxyribonuclease I activity protein [Homalodisca vitripennis]
MLQLAPFPLYMSTGEMEATVREVLPITLSEANLKRISDFHGIIFDHVLKVSKEFMIRNFKNTQNSYLIAPVIRDSSGRVTIDWNVMEEVKNPFPSTETKPSNSERQNLSITDENYLGKIVSPWYRTVPTQGNQRATVRQFHPAHHTFYRVDPPEECRLCEDASSGTASSLHGLTPTIRAHVPPFVLEPSVNHSSSAGGRGFLPSDQSSLEVITILKGLSKENFCGI